MVAAVLDPLDQVDAVAGLERDVDDGHVGVDGGEQLQRLGNVGRFAADFQVGLPGDPDGQPFAHGRVVIDDQDLRGRLARVRLAPGHWCGP